MIAATCCESEYIRIYYKGKLGQYLTINFINPLWTQHGMLGPHLTVRHFPILMHVQEGDAMLPWECSIKRGETYKGFPFGGDGRKWIAHAMWFLVQQGFFYKTSEVIGTLKIYLAYDAFHGSKGWGSRCSTGLIHEYHQRSAPAK